MKSLVNIVAFVYFKHDYYNGEHSIDMIHSHSACTFARRRNQFTFSLPFLHDKSIVSDCSTPPKKHPKIKKNANLSDIEFE